jgi:hypothetical protein
MLSYPRAIDPNGEVEDGGGYKAEQWTSFGGLRCGGERARARRSGAAMAAQFSPCRSRMREGEEMGQLRCGVAALKAPWTDRWGQDRRTVATACPRVGEGLWPVGHSPPSDETESR